MTDTELKPCPFCGNPKPVLLGPNLHMAIFVLCYKCGAKGLVVNGGHGGTPEEAIAAWNTRAPVVSHETPSVEDNAGSVSSVEVEAPAPADGEVKRGNFVAVTTEEPQIANWHTAIYEDDYKGLLIALCNQNGRYPWQVQAILNGLNGKKEAADLLTRLSAQRDAVIEECALVAAKFAREPARASMRGRMTNRLPVVARPLAKQALRIAAALRALKGGA